MDTFPPVLPFWGNDHLVSSLDVTITDTLTGQVENVVLTNSLKIRRGSATKNSEGSRLIPLTIIDWNAAGFSNLLGDRLAYRMAKYQSPLESFARAQQSGKDYPASVELSAKFDFLLGDEIVVTNIPVTAVGVNIKMVPPNSHSILKVNKPIQYGKYLIKAVQCSSFRMSLTGQQKKILKIGTILKVVHQSFPDSS